MMNKKESKWAKFAREEPAYLDGAGDHVMKCSNEIRGKEEGEFNFKKDE